mgnify:FL=1
MKTNKINALEAVIAALEISENELTNWFNNRGKDKTGLIPTELPLVYRRGNVLTVENGLNLSRKHELWGIQLLSGVMVALACRSGNNVSDTIWNEVKKFAEKMRLNGKSGFLPSKDVLNKHWGKAEREKFTITIAVLKENNIDADSYWGCIWCSEVYDCHNAYYFILINGDYDWYYKNITNYDNRVALAFS